MSLARNLFSKARQFFAATVVAASSVLPFGPRLNWFRAGETSIAADIRAILGAFTPRSVGLKERLMMRDDPDVAFGLAILRAPIVNLQWSIESEDEEVAAFAETVLRPVYRQLAIAGSLAMHFGNVVISKEWEVVDNFEVRQNQDASGKQQVKSYPNALILRRFKAIDPVTCTILIDQETDDWAGVEQNQGDGVTVRVGREGVVFWAYRRQEVWGKLKGYPVSNQSYDPWYTKHAIRFCRNRYMEKRADPPWKGRAQATLTKGGKDVDGFQYMHEQLDLVKGGGSVLMPNDRDDRGNYLFDAELMQVDKRGDMFQQAIDAESTQILRSMWITDKAGTSDGSGSLAMAQVHAETMALGLEAVLFEWLEEVVNPQVLQQLVEFNFGKERAQKAQVRLVGKGISPEMRALFKDLILNLIQVEQLQADGKSATLLSRIDGPALAQQLNVPLRSEDEVKAGQTPAKTAEEIAAEDLTKPGDQLPAPAPDQGVPTEQDVKVAEAAVLNGAQISAAVDIVAKVGTGEIPEDSALGMIEVLFNLTTDQAKQILGSAKAVKKDPGPPPVMPPSPTAGGGVPPPAPARGDGGGPRPPVSGA
jgi:hypothetical protein